MTNPFCPFARQRPLVKAAARRSIVPTASCAHTAVTGASGPDLAAYFEGVQADSHFYVDHDGVLWQYIPVDREAWAEVSGNIHTVSYETWDGGDPSVPWNPAQLATIGHLLQWLQGQWQVPTTAIRDPAGPGAGYHSQFPGWNPDHHACPGTTRVGQLMGILAALNATPIGVPDMVNVCIPSWAGRAANDRVGFYRLSDDLKAVTAWNGAPLNGPLLATSYMGIPLVVMPALNAPPIGICEIGSTGAVVVVCADGGIIDIAAKPV